MSLSVGVGWLAKATPVAPSSERVRGCNSKHRNPTRASPSHSFGRVQTLYPLLQTSAFPPKFSAPKSSDRIRLRTWLAPDFAVRTEVRLGALRTCFGPRTEVRTEVLRSEGWTEASVRSFGPKQARMWCAPFFVHFGPNLRADLRAEPPRRPECGRPRCLRRHCREGSHQAAGQNALGSTATVQKGDGREAEDRGVRPKLRAEAASVRIGPKH